MIEHIALCVRRDCVRSPCSQTPDKENFLASLATEEFACAHHMRTSKFTETQIITILKQGDALLAVKDLCRQAGISTATYYQWKSKYGGLDASEHRRVKDLETENARLKRMYAEMALNNAALKDLMANNYRAGSEAEWLAPIRRGSLSSLHRPIGLGLPTRCLDLHTPDREAERVNRIG